MFAAGAGPQARLEGGEPTLARAKRAPSGRTVRASQPAGSFR